MALKWGIAGAGKISTQFAKAVSVLPKDEHELGAVASQNLQRAQEFSKDLNISKAYGNYISLAEDNEIDIVYVGNLNTQHLEVAKLMLSHGKHVLCEKPLTINERGTSELIEYARSKNLFLMEAIWSRCFPSYVELQKLIKSGLIGDVMYIYTTFGRAFDYVERLQSKDMGGGTILDLGIYALQLVQFICEKEEPISIVSSGHLNQNGVDESASAILTYSGGKTAIITSHARANLPNEAVIIGTKGSITIPRFWCPTTIVTPTQTINFDLPNACNVQFKHPHTVGMCYEIQEVRNCIKNGLVESPKITHKESIQLARIMDKIRKDIGVKFPEDEF